MTSRGAVLVTALACVSATTGCGHHTTSRQCKGTREPQTQSWAVDGGIGAIAVVCGTTYVGGDFTSIGPPTGAATLVDAATGRRQPFPIIDGEVHVVVDDGSGGWFIAGELKSVAGEPCAALAHIAHGSLDWCPMRAGEIEALARDRRHLYVAYAPNHWTARLASFDIPTRQRLSWAPSLGTFTPTPCNPEGNYCGPSSSVSALVARRGVVYIGGSFSSVAGSALSGLAAVDGTTGRLLAFDGPLANTGGMYVGALALSGNLLYVGGDFDRVGSTQRSNLAALDARTGVATPWAPRVSGPNELHSVVSAIAIAGNRVAIAGSLRRVNGVARRGFALLTAASGNVVPTTFGVPSGEHDVSVVLAANSARVYLSTAALNQEGTDVASLAAVDPRSGRRVNWSPQPNGAVTTIVPAGPLVLLGGRFSSVNIAPRTGLAAIGPGARLQSWAPRVRGSINVFLPTKHALYVGGNYSRIANQPRTGVAAFALPSLRLLSWHPVVAGPAYSFEGLQSLAAGADDRSIYLAGEFDFVNGARRDNVAAVGAASGRTLPFNPPPADIGVPYTVASVGGKVFVGGNPSTDSVAFTAFDEKGKPVDWKDSIQLAAGEVRALAVAGGSVYAAGSSLPDYGVARMDLDDGRLLPLSLKASSQFPEDVIDAMVADGSNVYVRLKAGHVAEIDGGSGRVRRRIPVCRVEDDEVVPRLAVAGSDVMVNCRAPGGVGEELVVVPFEGRP